MRINPLGSYREVQRLIDLPSSSARVSTPEFASTLASIAPDSAKKGQNSAPSQPVSIPPPEMHASLRIANPDLLIRPLLPEQPEIPPELPFVGPPAPDRVPEPSVKSPTLLSAKRVSIDDPYAGMSLAEREEAVAVLVKAAGARHGIDPALSMAVVATESAFNARAVSTDGHASKGLMQLLDSTGQEQHREAEHASDYRPFHPPINVDLGVRYLRQLHDMFGTATTITSSLSTVPAANSASLEKLAVASYNAGQGRVAAAQQRAERAGQNPAEYTAVEPYLPQSTQEYVRRVLEQREQYELRFAR